MSEEKKVVLKDEAVNEVMDVLTNDAPAAPSPVEAAPSPVEATEDEYVAAPSTLVQGEALQVESLARSAEQSAPTPPLPEESISEFQRLAEENKKAILGAFVLPEDQVNPAPVQDDEKQMLAVLDEMEKALDGAPLEEGVSKVEAPPEVQFADQSLGDIIHNGKFFSVYPPVDAPKMPEDPLYLIVEKQAVGAAFADAEKLMVFEWGLVRLKDRTLADENGKRVLAVIRAQF